MSYNNILRVEEIYKQFGATVAVDNISFNLDKRDFLGLVGENGAGKTTLIKMIGGEYKPDRGKIIYKGKETNWETPSSALREGIGIVHQKPLNIPVFSAEENIFLGKEFVTKKLLLDNYSLSNKANNLLKNYPICPNLNLKEKVSNMSPGEMTIVEILKILSYDSDLLILDEPTASLSKNESENLFNSLLFLNKEKSLTIIYISHKIDEIMSLCNKIMVIRNGKNLGVINKNKFNKDSIIRMMINQDIQKFYPDKSNQMGSTVVEIKNLNNGKLKNINLNVKEGEIVGLYGLMGAGMTNVIRCIFGIEKFNDGIIEIKNVKEFHKTTVLEMINQGVYLIPGDRHKYGIFHSFNVRENTTIAHLKNFFPKIFLNKEKETKITHKELSKFHVKYADLDQCLDEVSGGNQQKIIIARWLMKNCKLMILDDPTVGIDIGTKKYIYNLLRELTKKGKGIIFVSSEINEIIGIADRVYTMREGVITGELHGEEINQKNILENIL
jgi:ribose transport system ATP-binding protein